MEIRECQNGSYMSHVCNPTHNTPSPKLFGLKHAPKLQECGHASDFQTAYQKQTILVALTQKLRRHLLRTEILSKNDIHWISLEFKFSCFKMSVDFHIVS